jgi:putative acetyltransferase
MIRKATPGDFVFIYELFMHPQINRFSFYELKTMEEFRPIFDNLLSQDILYIYEADGRPAGTFKFMPQPHRASHIIVLGGVAIHPLFGGKGHGQQMLKEILLLGKEMKCVRLELGVSAINTKAIHLYEKAGFEKEGLLKKYIYLTEEDVYLDDILMAYFY